MHIVWLGKSNKIHPIVPDPNVSIKMIIFYLPVKKMKPIKDISIMPTGEGSTEWTVVGRFGQEGAEEPIRHQTAKRSSNSQQGGKQSGCH